MDAVDQLHVIEHETNDDGTVNAEIRRVVLNGVGENIEIQYLLPSGEVKNEYYSWPERDTDDYRVVQLCEELGFTVSQIESIEGEMVKYDSGVVFEQSGWESVKGKLGSAKDRATFKHGDDSILLPIAFWPILAFLAPFLSFYSDLRDEERMFAIGIFSSQVWFTIIALFIAVFVWL